MNYKKIAVAVVFIAIAIVTTSLFWTQPVLLSGLIVILAVLKHIFSPIKLELLWFFLAGILGATTECLIMLLGGNPWSYVQLDFINVPMWLVPLWGMAGIVFITLHEGVLKK